MTNPAYRYMLADRILRIWLFCEKQDQSKWPVTQVIILLLHRLIRWCKSHAQIMRGMHEHASGRTSILADGPLSDRAESTASCKCFTGEKNMSFSSVESMFLQYK